MLQRAEITPVRSGLSHQKCHDGFVNDRRCSIETYYPLYSGTPNYRRHTLPRDNIDANKDVIGKQCNDLFLPPLRWLRQEEFWEESLNPPQAKVHFRKLLPLRLGVNRTPLFIALRHFLRSI